LHSKRSEHEKHCRRLWRRLRSANAAVVQAGSPEYPLRWQFRSEAPPPIVYAYGNRAVLGGPTLAVLNSRSLTECSVTATLQIVRRAAREAFTVICGGMKGTHRIAAAAVRSTGTNRVIVLDRGLFAAFGQHLKRDPFGLGPEKAPLDRASTLVLSPFRPLDFASPGNGRRRDGLIADLADVVIAAMARPGGEIERICLRRLDRRQCVLTWQAENSGLVSAGAIPVDESDLQLGLRRFL
jgi:predicted Rossmann fold nucleotide-binding protein DprA/Smf involved in DNA uptake